MSELIDKVARERYLRGDEKVMDDVYERVAVAVGKNVAVLEGFDWENRFFDLMSRGIFLPNTPTLSNAGTDNPMLSACFGLPVNDSFEGPGGIYDSLINSARIFKMGGGVGYNFSNLRSKGAKVQSTDGVASGPVSFMRLYDANVGVIKQGGRRRGAAIGILNVDHADIREFITCKSKEGDISNFNISVMLTDVFMEHIHDVAGKEIFDMIVDGIYNNGEPGVLFYDNMNIDNPNKHIYDIHTTNPCGELPIGVDSVSGGGEACNLGSINVAKCVNEKYPSNFDWNMLTDITRDATVFLDTIIDMNEYPTKAIGDMTKSTRKIGLGLMGLHDALIMMGYGYDSHDGRMMAKNIMLTIQNVAQETSQKLALELGCYPEWYGSEWEKKNIPMRNSTLTCVAPTGTISILAKCSSGIEPHYNWVYQRANTMDGEYLICVPIFDEMITKLVNEMSPPDIKKNLYEYYNVIVFDTVDSDEWYIQNSDDTEYFGDIREKFIDCIKQDCYEKGTIQHMKFIPEETRMVYVNALDINWIDHLEMQGELQKWCDNSISKTVNMSNDVTKKDVADAIKLAWKLGCKGFTMYREGSRKDVVLKLKDKTEPFVKVDDVDITPAVKDFTVTIHKPIPMQSETKRVLPSTRYKVQSGCGELYIHVAEDNGKIREVFVECGGSGGCAANNNAIGRLISLGLKHNVPINAIIRQLKKVKCDACIRNSNAEGKSCADIIGKVLEESSPVDEDTTIIKHEVINLPYIVSKKTNENGSVKCPECESTVVFEGRCFTCPNCGFSKCG